MLEIDSAIEHLITQVSQSVSLLEFHRVSHDRSDSSCAVGFRIDGAWVYGENLPSQPYFELNSNIDQLSIEMVDKNTGFAHDVPIRHESLRPEDFNFSLLELSANKLSDREMIYDAPNSSSLCDDIDPSYAEYCEDFGSSSSVDDQQMY